MTDFQIYFDTGGAEHQGEMLVTVGLVASVKEWDEFDKRWLAVLSKFNISSFHMTEIACWNPRNDIAKWPLVDCKRDEKRRDKFLAELIGAAIGIRKAFVRAVALGDYNVANKRYPLTEKIGGPYTYAQAQCLINAQEWLRESYKPNTEHRLGVTVEKGDAGQKYFRKFCDEQLTYKPTFGGKKNDAGEVVTPLALADLVAYEHFRWYTRVAQAKAKGEAPPGKKTWNQTLFLMRDALPIDAGIIEETLLERFCNGLKLAPRQ